MFMPLSGDWAYLSLAAGIAAAVTSAYALPRWLKRAEAKERVVHDRFLDEVRQIADRPQDATPEIVMPACANHRPGNDWQDLQAADREMVRKVSEWRDARRGRHPARHDG